MSEDLAAYVTTPPTTNGDKPLPRRLGTRGLLPSTWISREIRIEYVGGDSAARETTGVLLDWCPVGMILLLAGARTIVGWDRIVLVELHGD